MDVACDYIQCTLSTGIHDYYFLTELSNGGTVTLMSQQEDGKAESEGGTHSDSTMPYKPNVSALGFG